MAVGLLRVWLKLYGTETLKDKRSLLEPLLVRARREFNVSAAELDLVDDPKAAVVGFAHLSNHGGFSDQVLTGLLRRLEGNRSFLVENWEIEVL
ncbi:MAG: hypothetical protein XD60_1159 [Acetothermia bacterium 64_32]|nr:MAG: hypothetical protein XD60_1159 [Acetothermia bacterium 64_32]MBC7098807.1 DUF503 domain-containing protein [Candidatus Bipolaricaulota bacterium]HAF70195.1 hypothetical protein [Candidatus Acetothermia bacterium]